METAADLAISEQHAFVSHAIVGARRILEWAQDGANWRAVCKRAALL